MTKSISGHVTDRMRERYSTVAPIEQRESIAKVIDFAQARSTSAGKSGDGVATIEAGAEDRKSVPRRG